VATIIEAARVLAQERTTLPWWFVAFCGEESALVGLLFPSFDNYPLENVALMLQLGHGQRGFPLLLRVRGHQESGDIRPGLFSAGIEAYHSWGYPEH